MTMKLSFILIALLSCGTLVLQAQDFGNLPLSLSPVEGINTSDNDYAPILNQRRDKFFLSSSRDGNTNVYQSNRLLQTTESLVPRTNESQIGGNVSGDARSRSMVQWTTPVAVDKLNTGSDDGSLSFSSDGSRVYFASDRPGGFGDADIYVADVVDGDFRNIRNLGSEINTELWESQPSISPDGKLLFFCSKRPDGIGAKDIWYSQLRGDGTWSTARVLDRTINTERDECTPFLSADGGTLVFASNGHAGFGGYDLFFSTRDVENAQFDWTSPTNLGGVVNSERDELFFYSSSASESFYISSSRQRDKGLDVYQGTPNLLGFGTQRVNIIVLDSLSGNPLPATVLIIDQQSGLPVATISTSAEQLENMISLPARRAYRVEAEVPGYPKRSVDISASSANTTQQVRIAFGTVGFDFSAYQIPFFVTGYYRPNTSNNLRNLFELRKTDLADANYIERFAAGSATHRRYDEYAKLVDELFLSVVHSGVDTIFSRFRSSAQPGEVLEVTVSGFADPKPILGRYVESESISFFDKQGQTQRVETGDRLSNLALSGLRAVHSARELQRMIEEYSLQKGRDDFASLLNSGRLRFRCIGGGINPGGTDYAAQRRIKIDFARVNNGQSKSEFDTNGLKQQRSK